MTTKNLSRRKFLTLAGLTGTGLGVASLTAACAPTAPNATPTSMAGMAVEMTNNPPTAAPGQSADDMDAMHKKGVETFVANAGQDTTFWRQPMSYKTDGDYKVFEVTCTEGQWEVAPGQSMDAMMYNGVVPGPEIRVTEGDKVRVICKNDMKSQSTSIHFHGVRVPNKMDGVPFITQDPIKPGGSFTYELQNHYMPTTQPNRTPAKRSDNQFFGWPFAYSFGSSEEIYIRPELVRFQLVHKNADFFTL